MELPAGVERVLEIARRVGNPLIVGGAVRDAAAGADPKDIDIEVHGASIDTLAQRFAENGFRVDEVGKQFGVLKVSKPGVVSDLDVAVPRRENRVGAGHRGFTVSHDADMTVSEAAERRDFTVNAILYDPKHQVSVDPFGGSADLKAGVLRHVSDKFSEDPLRVLRGVQLAGRFAMTMDPGTAALCRKLRPEFDDLATERVQEEWAKMFTKSVRPDLAVQALRDSAWDDTLPGLRAALADHHTVESLSQLPQIPAGERVVVGAAVIAAVMSPQDRGGFLRGSVIGKEAQRVAADLASADPDELANSYTRKVRAYTLAKRDFTFHRYLLFCRLRGDSAGVLVAEAAVAEGLGPGPEPAMIQGRDIVALASRKPGPWVGELVEQARDRQYRGEFTDRAAAITWLREQLVTH